MKSQIFKTAWSYFKKSIFNTFGECLKAAWAAFKVRLQLKETVLYFRYRKSNGAIREAKGTLNTNYFQFTPKGTGNAPKPDVIKYFDLEKQAFRSFRIERLVSF